MERDRLKDLLLEFDWDEVVRLALKERRVIRGLFGLLYDADDFVHWLAIEAIGRVGGALAAVDPEKVRELARRLLWSLNDESGSTPWGAAGAVGAIAAGRPDLFGGYMSILYPFHEDASLAPEIIWSAAAVGRTRPELVSEYIPFLLAALSSECSQIRGYAAWASGVLQLQEARQQLSRLAGDEGAVAVYCGDGCYLRSTVAALAADSADKLKALLLVEESANQLPLC
jgi:HEAT repeat protein